MTRLIFRIFFAYFLFALLRFVERRFGFVGILVMALVVLLPLALIRYAPLIARLAP